MTLCASNSAGGDSIEWVLNVVSNNYADMRIVSTRNVDFAVPGWLVTWLDHWQPHRVVDAAYDRLQRLTGVPTGEGKQIVMFAPEMGGAVSGQPLQIGPGWMTLEPVDGWHFAGDVYIHEVGHNFNSLIQMPDANYWPWFDSWFHHGCELLERPILERLALALPLSYGLPRETRSNFLAHVEREKIDATNRFAAYATYLTGGGRATNYTGDTYGAWSRMCVDLQKTYGPAVLENTVRAYRRDGVPLTTKALADTVSKKMTLLFCIMSAAAGTDLRSYFTANGFDVDNAFYASVNSAVLASMASLPDEEAGDGWKHSPLNSHYYKLTGWAMPWAEAERVARRLGGHLASVRSAAEESWLTSRFGTISNLWIGLGDQAQEGVWQWASGEPVTYVNWGASEPNGGVAENSVILNDSATGRWSDKNGTSRYRGLIEITNLVQIPVPPEVSITAMVSYLSEGASRPGQFRIVSTTNGPLQVGIEIRGTATPGVDYVALANTVTIPAGTNEVSLFVQPIQDDLPEGLENIVITLTNSPARVWPNSRAEMWLYDDDYVVGALKSEVYTNITGSAVSSLTANARYPNQPDVTDLVYSLEGGYLPGDLDDNYGERLSGWIIPPVTGNYTFYIASDDASELWLSTNSSSANKQRIASVSGWTYFRYYTSSASQISPSVALVQNRWYYLEVLHKEGGGGDHLSVTWKPPGGSTPQNGAAPIPGSVLAARIPTSWPRPSVSLSRSNTASGLVLGLAGAAQAACVLEVSETLSNWTALATNQPGTQSDLPTIDPAATNRPLRFYRTRLLTP